MIEQEELMLTSELAYVLGGIALAIYLVIALIMKKKPRVIIQWCAMIGYLSALASVTVFPLFIADFIPPQNFRVFFNLMPFGTVAEAIQYSTLETAVMQIGGNVAMTIPFGVLVMLILKNPTWRKKLLLALALPVSVELIQAALCLIGSGMRVADIDDVILNTLGVYIGYLIYRVFRKILHKIPYPKKTTTAE